MIEVRLQNEHGQPSCDEDVGIEFPIPTGDDSYRMLCYIDPYGDTVFNRLQMVTFLLEWETLSGKAKEHGSLETWLAVKKFAQKCNEGPHLYLRFIGD